MFPQLQGNEEPLVQSSTSPIPWTYRFDWLTRQFMRGADGRYLKTTTYAKYLEEVAKKLLHTKRFKYSIYSDRIGVDFLSDVGKMRPKISLPVIKQDVQDALEAHIEIERVDVFDIRFEDKKVIFALSIEGMRGKTKVEVDVWQR